MTSSPLPRSWQLQGVVERSGTLMAWDYFREDPVFFLIPKDARGRSSHELDLRRRADPDPVSMPVTVAVCGRGESIWDIPSVKNAVVPSLKSGRHTLGDVLDLGKGAAQFAYARAILGADVDEDNVIRKLIGQYSVTVSLNGDIEWVVEGPDFRASGTSVIGLSEALFGVPTPVALARYAVALMGRHSGPAEIMLMASAIEGAMSRAGAGA